MTAALSNGSSAPQANGHVDSGSASAQTISSKANATSTSPDPVLFKRLRDEYTAADQSHVFTFYDTLSPSDQSSLLSQLESIDIHRVNRIYRNAVAADGPNTPPPPQPMILEEQPGGNRLFSGTGGLTPTMNNLLGRSRTPSPPIPQEWEPLRDEDCATIVNNPTEEATWRDIGLKAVASNSVAVLLLAGGQGTRLGSSSPKGMYDIGLPSKSVLFDLQSGRIKKLARLAEKSYNMQEGEVRIRWYVMTSGPTRPETEKFFLEKNYFGLDKKDVIFFEQGACPAKSGFRDGTAKTVPPRDDFLAFIILDVSHHPSLNGANRLGVLPALSNEGKLLLSSPSSVSVAPDGNGGLYASLRRPMTSDPSSPSILSDMRTHGVQHIHVYGVDNCLVRVADPTFIGVCIDRNAECGAKVVRKTVPTESVGVVARRGNNFGVVEYSELPKDKSELRASNGQLAFRAANIVNHYFTLDFLDRVEAMERKMAFHIARKKIPTVDLESGEPLKPSEPNGMKLELFVFDVFPYTDNLTVLEVERQEEFSPLKNAPGSKTDGPETSKRDLLAQQKRWLEGNGATLAEGVDVEVLPQVTYAGEGLEWVKGLKFGKSGVIEKVGETGDLTA